MNWHNATPLSNLDKDARKEKFPVNEVTNPLIYAVAGDGVMIFF
jgi:hypothetical protein